MKPPPGSDAAAAERTGPRRMWLYILKGTFFPPGAGGAAAESMDIDMDVEVWKKLPDDLIWKVLQFVPAAKLFQLHLVSRKWRQVLTSAEFRRGIRTGAESETQQQPGVVVAAVRSRAISSSSRLKALVIDLSFVPDSFWKPGSYSVVAAGHGLVCISNTLTSEPDQQFCVLNPLTRTCRVLPNLPFPPTEWLPPTAGAVTIHGHSGPWGPSWRSGRKRFWRVATYDLAAAAAAAAAAAGWVSATYGPVTENDDPWPPINTVTVGGGGQAFWYYGQKVHVVAPTAAGGRLVDAAVAIDAPSVESMGMDPETVKYSDDEVQLLAHRGDVFLLADLMQGPYGMRRHDYFHEVCCVWRLKRDRMEWEPVTQLYLPDVARLVGLESIDIDWVGDDNFCAVGVRDILYCFVDPLPYLVGYNLDTRKWEVILDTSEWKMLNDGVVGAGYPMSPNAFELRPDLFL